MTATNYRLAMLDVDGTLQHRGQWNPGALELVDLLHRRGITVALCSGRTTGSMIWLADQLGHVSFISANSGSTVLEKQGDQWATLAHRALAVDAVGHVIEKAAEAGIEVWIHTEREWLAEERTPRVDLDESFVGDSATVQALAARDDVGKLLLHTGDPGHEGIARGIGELPGVAAVASSSVFVDLVPEVSASAKGGDVLIERLGLGWEQVIAIGDSENDRGMLCHAGLAITIAPMTVDALTSPAPWQRRGEAADTAGALDVLREELDATLSE
ncbi:MAG: HAD family hydrolase [Tessaracoccus sp.]